MNFMFPLLVSGKLYLWKLFHSLINYFFNLHIKKAYNINKNCYIFVKRLGSRNEILINYLNCGSNKYYHRLEFKFIKFIMSLSRQIPIISIENIDISPAKLSFDNKKENLFKLWNNSHYKTANKLGLLDSLQNEFSKYIIIRINNIRLYLKSYMFIIHHFRIIKNNNKTRIFIAKCKIYFKDVYIGSLRRVRLSHDENTNNINIYGDKMLLVISNNFLKFPIIDELSQIMKMFGEDGDGKLPNIFFKEIVIQFTINNHLRLTLTECFLEEYILKCNILVKIWQKEILWFKKCSYNILKNELDIDNVRMRLFKSTADKIFKTFRPLYKNFYRPFYKKSNRAKSGNIDNDNRKMNNDASIQDNYLDTIDESESLKSTRNSLLDSYHPIMNDNYLMNCDEFIVKKLFNINKLTIDFEDNNGSFIFNNFEFRNGEDGFRVCCSKWTFIKNNIVFLDSVNDKSKFTIEYQNGSLLIFPYHLYINFSMDDFANTFSEFSKFISRITNIFSTGQANKNNYIYEKFYIDSSRLLFSYKSKPIKMTRLLSGKYIELLNALNINDLDFILREITLNYPKNFDYILSSLISNILDDILNNNFDTLIKTTPIASTYKLKQIISGIPALKDKVMNMIG